MSEVLNRSYQDGVLVLRFNRPEVFNSFNKELALACQAALEEARDDESVRCIVLTGEGKAFCAGQDLKEVTDPEGPELTEIVGQHYNPIIKLIREIEKPIIAAVNGVAAGAGANIALACDMVYASEKASFIQAFSKIGLIPDSGGTYFLPRLIGLPRAMAYAITGEKIDAATAQEIGMIYKSVPVEEFENQVFAMAKSLAEMPTKGDRADQARF